MAGGVSVSRLGRAFRGMDIAVDRLKVGQTPIIEQLRPWGVHSISRIVLPGICGLTFSVPTNKTL